MSEKQALTTNPESAWAVDKGRRRHQNEDSIAAIDVNVVEGDYEKSVGIYAVADGIGGAAYGEIASSLAVNTLVKELTRSLSDAADLMDADYEYWLKQAVKMANQVIYHNSKDMGTTLVASLVVGQMAYIANVGDSRAYHINEAGISQITNDQSMVQALLRAGIINEAQAKTHPYRNILEQAIGKDADVQPELHRVHLSDSSTLLLCSDGLTNELSDELIYEIITEAASLQEACDKLIEKANQNGGRDNISALIVKPDNEFNYS